MAEALGRTAVLVVNFRSSALLEQNLAPLTSAAPELHVVVVDNYSGEDERRAMRSLADRHGWTTIWPDTNLGFGEGMNLAARQAIGAGAEQLLLLNPDASITRESLGGLVDVVRGEPMVMAAPRILRPDGSEWFAGSDLDLGDGRTRSRRKRIPGRPIMEWLTGACVLVSTTLWERIGGFEPAYFLYWEDVDLSWKVQHAGGTVRVVDAVHAVHAPGGTLADLQGSRPSAARSTYYYYFNVRNRMVFAALRLSRSQRRGWLRATAAVSREILLRGGRRQFLHPTAPIGAAVRGVRDGFRLARMIDRGEPIREPSLQRRLRTGRVGGDQA